MIDFLLVLVVTVAFTMGLVEFVVHREAPLTPDGVTVGGESRKVYIVEDAKTGLRHRVLKLDGGVLLLSTEPMKVEASK
jgi:hypothetical protein